MATMWRGARPSPGYRSCGAVWWRSLGAGLAALVLAGASPAQTLRWASQGDALTMDPQSQNEGLNNALNGQVYERLTRRNRQLDIVPALATSWTQVAPLAWRFRLRAGVKFHDGTPFTADDVVFSVNRAKSPVSTFSVYANALGTPVAVDPLTVEFRLDRVNPIFLQHLDSIPVMSRAWSEKHRVTRPLDFKNKEESHASFHANGTGPYVLVSRQPGIRTTYRRHAGWWDRFEGSGGDGRCRRLAATCRRSSTRRSPTTRRGWPRSSPARSTSCSTRPRATCRGCAASPASGSSRGRRTG